MNKNLIITKKGSPYPMGATVIGEDVNFSVSLPSGKEQGIILYCYNSKDNLVKIPFTESNRIGNLWCAKIEKLSIDKYDYNYYVDDEIIVDPYAKKIVGNEKWGQQKLIDKNDVKGAADVNEDTIRIQIIKSGFNNVNYDWENDSTLCIPYSESIIYGLHVRGFSKHSSSKCKFKGTFEGIIEKLDYLKNLGITTIELMPAYDFEETGLVIPKELSMEETVKKCTETMEEKIERINYWGFLKGHYFAPKEAYSACGDGIKSMKNLVKSLHKNGIEIIMQFYFPEDVKPGYILEVLKYWVIEYHIDGFHLQGGRIPITLLATEPLFANTKIIYYDFPIDDIYDKDLVPGYKNLACYNDDCMYLFRRFLKSDEDMLRGFLNQIDKNPQKTAVINYIASYYGFSLWDLVSYDVKHNLENGEDNRDGNNYNYSWNCGVEGVTKKKTVLELRKKQVKNALVYILLSQGTPYIMSGDEFGQTRKGNNNSYCQDNEISWLNWDNNKIGKEILNFTRELIVLRKSHPILHKPDQLRMMDYLGCGYPDLSYHGEEPWRPVVDNYCRHVGVMYCGKYAKVHKRQEDEFLYIAYNMHWEEHNFALPKLPKGKKWYLKADTGQYNCDCLENGKIDEKKIRQPGEPKVKMIEAKAGGENLVRVPDRRICIFISGDIKA